jgi:hypothetical protein
MLKSEGLGLHFYGDDSFAKNEQKCRQPPQKMKKRGN